MLDFENLDKLSNVICRINTSISLKHVVELKNSSKDFNQYGFYYSTKNSNNGNLMFNNRGYISLENKKTIVGNNGIVNSSVVRVKMTPMDLPLLTEALNVATGWIIGNSGVFANDGMGHPISIRDLSIKTQCPLISENSGLIIKPCIIDDVTSIKYQGISLSNHVKGEICDFTATEFMMFKNYVITSLNNLYSNNLLLAIHGMQYCEYKNLMEVLNKRR